MSVLVKPEIVGGKEYLTVNKMAAITNKSSQTIYWLINKGNAIRKMKSEKFVDRLLIPIEELIEFPFTSCGRENKNTIYHYDRQGKIVEDEPEGRKSE